jgi:serine/threonine protein kinase
LLQNILLVSEDDHVNIKITDFGLAHKSKTAAAPDMLLSKCGTPMYMAPEVHMGEAYTAGVDVWAVGVILYIMLSGTLPFYAETSQDFHEIVTEAQYEFPDEEWADISDDALDLIEQILGPLPPPPNSTTRYPAHSTSPRHQFGHHWSVLSVVMLCSHTRVCILLCG